MSAVCLQMTDDGADKYPIPYSPIQFFSVGSFAFGLQRRALREVESPCRFLKDDSMLKATG
ncbi:MULTISPECIES: hypothetical protein [unclassified Microcoleus]|uniref:hypothetical protein n=2 Tax=Microcoleus TaxID=44471 RepID=UPI0025CF5635|nr:MULTISPECIES: hypothetical protein [unclassified Microcoleus]